MERVTNEAKKKDIGILLLQDDLMPLLLVDISERAEISPVFFPSSRFFAYESNEDGTYQIYEKEISSLTNQSISLSRDWGTGFNIWSQDRFEIFFCSIGKKLADKVKLEPEMYFSLPTELLALPRLRKLLGDVTANGQRFLNAQ